MTTRHSQYCTNPICRKTTHHKGTGDTLTCCECGSVKEVKRLVWLPQPRLDAVLACAVKRD